VAAILLGLVLAGCQGKTIDQAIADAMEPGVMQDLGDDILVEMDMRFTPEEWALIQEQNKISPDGPSTWNAIRDTRLRWTNKVVPYEYRSGFSSSDRSVIQSSMDEYHRYTCVKFQARSGQSNYIYFTGGSGCSSYVGMIGRGQPVTLAGGCRRKPTVIHELGHAVGFHHEQTRPDRDNYVTIHYSNIQSGTEFNFNKYSTNTINDFGVPYDYASIMHYGQYAFSTNGRPTITTKDSSWQHKIGTGSGLSFRDIKLTNLMYSCGGHCGSKTCPGEGYLDKNCECQCPGNPIQKCDGTGGGGGGTGGGGGDSSCTNHDQYCDQWASQGYCTDSRYSDFMESDCAKACKFCTAPACSDNHSKCDYWASIGECNANPNWMLYNCQLSCKQCTP